MAIKKITGPIGGQAPSSTDDYIAQNNILGILQIGFKNPLTEYETSNIPKIAEGAPIRHGGSCYVIPVGDGDSDISGSVSDGEVYVKLTPSIDGSILSARFSSSWTASYNKEYGGWYDGLTQFLPYGMTKTGSVFSDKFEYIVPNNLTSKVFSDGSISATNVSASGGIKKGLGISSSGSFSGINVTGGAIYSAISPLFSNIGDSILLSGEMDTFGFGFTIVNRAEMVSATEILVSGIGLKWKTDTIELRNYTLFQSQTSNFHCSIAW